MSLYIAAALQLSEDGRQLFPGIVPVDVLAFGRFASTGTTVPVVTELSLLGLRSVSHAGLSVYFRSIEA